MGFCFLFIKCYNRFMNKRLFFLSSLLALSLLSGCKIIHRKSSNSSEENNFIGGDLIFSEFYVGDIYSNRAIELANVGEKTLDLSKYHINIYRDGGENPEPTEQISLSGSLAPDNTYIIAYSGANDELKNKANLISEDFLNDGTFPMVIANEKEEQIDCLGYPGFFYDIANKTDAVRKRGKLFGSIFYPYFWIHYPTSNLDNLGNLNCLDDYTIFAGPKLSAADFSAPYAVDDGIGGGGAIEVSLVSTIDGDTTRFNFGSSLSAYDISGTESVRYYGINTPEIAHGDSPADPYGPEARDFTNSLIKKAKHFVVQSVKGYSLRETYGRLLGYVWVSDEESPNPEDYYLLNHRIVQNGYARIGYIDRGGYNDYMLYNNISYVEFLFDAQQYAILRKLHIYEEGL